MSESKQSLDIIINGARKHNLKNISLSIPRHKITAITGVSGAGKSSLAFDTLFAEGQRRFLESLSTYARRFLGKIDRGNVDSIYGLAPSIAIDRQSTSRSPRSTVATLTEIYDYFRIMWARLGTSRSSLKKELDPKNFSFNSHFGACERCQGLGEIYENICPECGGKRLKHEFLAVKIDGKSISDACKLSISEAYSWFKEIPFDKTQKIIATPLLKEILGRMEFLINVGIPYLSLDRTGDSLSGGEAQRLRLAGQIGSGLEGVLYVLDEPTIGLHQSDTKKLLDSLYHLRDLGNTIVVVEHDLEFIKASDYIIDLGPGAGEDGGEAVAMGTPCELSNKNATAKFPLSVTIPYLAGKKALEDLRKSTVRSTLNTFSLVGLTKNNLKNISVKIQFGGITAISGVSGSGKSTLMNCILEKAEKKKKPVCFIDQSPINSSPRSTPVSYMNILEKLRELFSKLPESKIRGYTPGRFAYNVAGGRCDVCEGRGYKLIEMHFLSDVWELCEACKGRRYNSETLSILWKGKSIADILDMRIEAAAEFFKDIKRIEKPLKILSGIGLGYLRVGQATTTMSGGEIQRLKLAAELYKSNDESTIFLLDEPSTGLHLQDIQPLWDHLRELSNAGHAVVFVEHHPDMLRLADWIIELGPSGGDAGGYLIQ